MRVRIRCMTRQHVCSIDLPASPEEVWAALITPSAIRAWWGAARVVVNPRPGGTWAAAWGADEDDPEYVSVSRLVEWEPPRRLRMADFEYHAREGGEPPYTGDLETEFRVEPADGGSRLTVIQEGFPEGPEGDEFYAACETGWNDTLASLRQHLGG